MPKITKRSLADIQVGNVGTAGDEMFGGHGLNLDWFADNSHVGVVWLTEGEPIVEAQVQDEGRRALESAGIHTAQPGTLTDFLLTGSGEWPVGSYVVTARHQTDSASATANVDRCEAILCFGVAGPQGPEKRYFRVYADDQEVSLGAVRKNQPATD